MYMSNCWPMTMGTNEGTWTERSGGQSQPLTLGMVLCADFPSVVSGVTGRNIWIGCDGFGARQGRPNSTSYQSGRIAPV